MTSDYQAGGMKSVNAIETAEKSALQLKRARERVRKKQKLESTRGAEASRRANFILQSLETAHEDFLLEQAIHSQQGYVGVPDGGRDWPNSSSTGSTRLAYLRDIGGYRLVDTSLNSRVDYPFVDATGRVWAVALAEPPNWEARRAGIAAARRRLFHRVAHLKIPFNRRGNFRSYPFGFSFGMGRTIPMNFTNSDAVNKALTEFFDNHDVQSLFRFAEGGLRTWFPDHWDQFHKGIESAQAQHPELRIPVPGTSFPASTVNVGDRVVCDSHRDASNEAAGICLDYVDGPFNTDEGGHLVFHEARRIVKLRKGGVILFPSAIVTHDNIDIGPTESRFSITGYVPGGVRRYLEAGGRTLKEWVACDPEAASVHDAGGSSRWLLGCARFKTAAELIRFWQAQSTK
ncbi:hypothetical protein FS837_009970 [Tulasnella sp. UAMH 9824]|nr:hypothetical protein FS837_009970 [Tulasnella sp. UAMH 9824]